VPVCFGDPAAFFSVGGERLGAYPLGGEDGQIGGAGAEAGAVPADVAYGQATWAARPSSARSAFRDSRLPWWMNRNWAGRLVRGCGIGRPAERVAA
jgi:hypothetical protein